MNIYTGCVSCSISRQFECYCGLSTAAVTVVRPQEQSSARLSHLTTHGLTFGDGALDLGHSYYTEDFSEKHNWRHLAFLDCIENDFRGLQF